MVRNLNSLIFIYILVVSCTDSSYYNNNPVAGCELATHLSVDAPSLELDENGYYHIEWLAGYNQTFATLEAVTNTEGWNRIYWTCDSGIEYGGEFVSCVNPASYTSDGVARQTMAVWEEMIGDTLTIYAGFEDWCYDEHIDNIRIIVEDEI